MGKEKSESTKELERDILKLQVKEAVISELDDIIVEKLQKLLGPALVEKIGSVVDFPLTVKQLAYMTGRTEANVYKMCQRGQIPFTKVRGQIHINLKDVNIHLLDLQSPD